MSEPAGELLMASAAFLDQGRTLDGLSRPLTAAALVALLIGPATAIEPPRQLIGFAMLVAIAGFGEAYFAMRVNFDAALFHQRAGAPEPSNFAAADEALTQLGLLPATKLGRPAEARITGARRLFRWQLIALLAQVLLVLVGAAVALAWH